MKHERSCKVNGCGAKIAVQNKNGYCMQHRDQSFHRRYRLLKRQAGRCISYDAYCQIVGPNVCSYCGGPLGLKGVGIDRRDSNKGYIKGNVVACCGTCNNLKGTYLSQQETLLVIDLLKKIRNNNVLWDKNPKAKRRKNGTKRR